MPWFKVDDQWHDHPKCLGLSFQAKGLWVHAGSWCAAKLTDGFVPKGAVKVWGAPPSLAAELVAHGLWVALDQGWQFHEWTEHQPSRADVIEKRQKVKERVAKHRARNAVTGALPNKTDAPCNDVTAALVTPPHVTLPPSRPVPTRPSSSYEEEKETHTQRAREVSDHWVSGQREHGIRTDFQQRYENAVQSIPNQQQVSKMAAKVAPWIAETARLRKLTEDVVTRRLFEGFFASDTARAKGFPPAYLGANPLEYFDPPAPKPPVRTIGGSRYAGSSEVAKPEDCAVNGDIKW